MHAGMVDIQNQVQINLISISGRTSKIIVDKIVNIDELNVKLSEILNEDMYCTSLYYIKLINFY